MIVIDASALVLFLADAGPAGIALRKRLEGESLVAPHLLDIETASALLGRRRGGKLTDRELAEAFETFAITPIRRVGHQPLLPRVRELYTNLSAYDASYVTLAEGYGIPLITCDARIARSGAAQCVIEVFGT
jgi:predicted nucleic acid-binding protein